MAMHSRVTAGKHVAEIDDRDARIERGDGEVAMAKQHRRLRMIATTTGL